MGRRLVVMALLMCAVSSGSIAQVPAPTVREPEVAASGRGEARIAPDYAYVTIGVTTQAPNAVDAASENARRIASATNAIRRFGLTEQQVTTSRYSLTQIYEHPRNGSPKPSGFSARNMIRAEVHRLDDVGKIIDAAIAAGATDVSGIQFLASNTDAPRRAAVTDAVRHARADADAMARAAGGSLGRLIAISSSGISQPVYRGESDFSARVAAGSAAIPTNIVPAELNLAAMVFGRWEFIPGPPR
jgi:uncharacterized protein YggE